MRKSMAGSPGAVESAAIHGVSAVIEEVEGIVDEELLDVHAGFDVMVAADQGEVIVGSVILVVARLWSVFAEAESKEVAETDGGQAHGFGVFGIGGKAIGRGSYIARARSGFPTDAKTKR